MAAKSNGGTGWPNRSAAVSETTRAASRKLRHEPNFGSVPAHAGHRFEDKLPDFIGDLLQLIQVQAPQIRG